MLAAFSRELAEHRADVVRIMTGHAKHVDAILDRVQGLVDENARLTSGAMVETDGAR